MPITDEKLKQVVRDAVLELVGDPKHEGSVAFGQDGLIGYLGGDISPRTVEKWRLTGRGPKFVRAGGRILYRKSDVDDWLDQQTRLSTSDDGQAVV